MGSYKLNNNKNPHAVIPVPLNKAELSGNNRCLIKFHSTALYSQQTTERSARERTLPGTAAVNVSPYCQVMGLKPPCARPWAWSPLLVVTRWQCHSLDLQKCPWMISAVTPWPGKNVAWWVCHHINHPQFCPFLNALLSLHRRGPRTCPGLPGFCRSSESLSPGNMPGHSGKSTQGWFVGQRVLELLFWGVRKEFYELYFLLLIMMLDSNSSTPGSETDGEFTSTRMKMLILPSL